jgi:hypothetical protein
MASAQGDSEIWCFARALDLVGETPTSARETRAIPKTN